MFLSDVLSSFWEIITILAPSLFLGLFFASVLHVLIKRETVFRHLGTEGISSVIKASFFGVPLPLCSCGVLPAAFGLRKDGASKGATTAFLISTPQTGIDSVFVTAGMLGFPTALFKLAAAFVTGVVGGFFVDLSEKRNGYGNEEKRVEASENDKLPVLRRMWLFAFHTVFRDIYRWLLFGIAVSAVITVVVPAGSLAEIPALNGPPGLFAALLLGIPLYVCSIASVPIAAALVYAGFPAGGALVFLMAGPATNAATMGAVKKVLGGRVFWIYMVVVLAGSLIAGFLFESVITVSEVSEAVQHTRNIFGEGFAGVSAVLLLVCIAWWLLSDFLLYVKLKKHTSDDETRKMKITGMSCEMCAARVQKALLDIPDIITARVSSRSGIAEISGPGKSDDSSLAHAIENAGAYRMETEDEN